MLHHHLNDGVGGVLVEIDQQDFAESVLLHLGAQHRQLGVSVATFVEALYATDVATEPPGPVSVTVVPLIDEASMARENVAVTVVVVATPLPPLAGVFAVTVGAVGAAAGEASRSMK